MHVKTLYSIIFGFLISGLSFSQTVDPYTIDENTILLMHFDGNLNEEASNYAVVNHGIAKSYIANPIPGLSNAIHFDNSSQANNSYITVPYSSELSMSNNWTIEFWFYIKEWDQNHNKWPVPILLPTAGWNANYYLEIPSTEGRLIYGFHSSDGGARILSSQNSITTGTWYHVALINDYDNNLIKLILHNADFQKLEEQSASYTAGTTISTGTQDLRIGNGTAGDNSFNGYLDELRISNVVRDYSIQYDWDSWETTTSDNFTFYYTKPELCTEDLIMTLENKFEILDKTIYQLWDNIYLLDRSQKIKVFLYDTDEAFVSAPANIREWDVGYYTEDEIHIKVPSAERQLKYFPNFEKAAISVLARYVMAKKRTSSPSNGLSFGFGLFESGYSPDLNLIRNYLDANSNTFPNSSTFSTWTQLDEELNVELAFTFSFASIIRGGYFSATVWNGLYDSRKDEWYQIIRIFFLIDIEDGGMRKFYDEDDFIVYANSQEIATLSLEALRWYADQFEEAFGARINHPLLVTIYGSDETYTYTQRGNIDEVGGGGEALSHSLLRTSPAAENLDTELNILFTKYSGIIGHEFMHNTFASIAETVIPSCISEGAAMNAAAGDLQGYNDVHVGYFDYFHNFFWNDNSMYFPDLDKIFDLDGNFGYKMSASSFTFIKENYSKETLLQFMKTPDDFSILGYSGIDEFQRHLYETLYHQYMPAFLFNPSWDIQTTFTPGTNYLFNWDGHYIEDLIIEYSVDGMNNWNYISEVSFSSGSYSWVIPNTDNCVLRFSDKRFPDINFTFQILGDKPTFGKVLNMTFENGAANNIPGGNNGRLKGDVTFEPRDGQNGYYAKFPGLWNAISVFNYQNLSLSENWTIQGDFLIENTSGLMNQKPVLLEKLSTDHWNKNYSISFNNNGQNHLFFSYRLENGNWVNLEIDDAGITEGNWYTFYFARSVENNIVEARVYNQSGNILSSTIRQINGEGKVLTGAGDFYMGTSNFYFNENCLQGGLDNIIISDTYHDVLMLNDANNAPIVSDISDQTIEEGSNFATINLDDFVSDVDHTDLELTWTTNGEVELVVSISDNRVATISIPNADWNGSETITFTATDPGGESASDQATFTVTPVNDGPVVTDIPNQTINEGSSFTSINLDDIVTDPDNVDSQLSWAFSGNNELSVEIDGNRVATISIPNADWNGSETITFIATDPVGDSGSDDAIFTVTAVNDDPVVSNIADQTIDEGGSFTIIQLDNFVTDIDNDDSEITWSYSGNSGLVVTIDGSRVATIITPSTDWNGSETITFTATDPQGAADSNDAVFTVNPGSFTLPSNNFEIEVISETCPNKNNGQIIIAANETHNYNTTINGTDYNFSTSLTVTDLAPNTYDFCITVTGETFEQCYSFEVAEGTTVSGKTSTTKNKATIEILEGTAPFDVMVNGVLLYQTLFATFDVYVEHGDVIAVKTSVDCEGVYSKTIELFDAVVLYPNPSDGIFEIAIPTNQKEVTIEVFNYASQLILSKTYAIQYGKVVLDLSNKPVGTYVVKVHLDKPVNVKIIKY